LPSVYGSRAQADHAGRPWPRPTTPREPSFV